MSEIRANSSVRVPVMERLVVTERTDDDGNLEVRASLDMRKIIRLDRYLIDGYSRPRAEIIDATKERLRQEFASDLYGEVHELGREILYGVQKLVTDYRYGSFEDSDKIRELCGKLMNFGLEKHD